EVSPSKKVPAAGAGATGIRIGTAGLSSPSSSSSSVQRQERGRQRYRGDGEEMLRNQECSSPTRVHLRRTGSIEIERGGRVETAPSWSSPLHLSTSRELLGEGERRSRDNPRNDGG
ncbi:unnamed protein product, partial [Ectocarpus sp. 4 AP-2014]